MIFQKAARRTHRFPMSKTTEPIIAPTRRAPQPQLAAEWQNGLETIPGFCQRKLRLVLAPGGWGRRAGHFSTQGVRFQ